jgi:hypothetical protein
MWRGEDGQAHALLQESAALYRALGNKGFDNDSSIFGPFVLLIHLLLFKPLKYCLDLKAVWIR